MQIFIGIVIGVLIGISYMALTLSFSYYDAYMNGVIAFKQFVFKRLNEMQEHTENVTYEQLMEELK